MYGLYEGDKDAHQRGTNKNKATAHPVSTFLRLLWLGVTRPPSIALEGGRQLRQSKKAVFQRLTKDFTVYPFLKSFHCSFYIACFEVSICFSGRWLSFHKFHEFAFMFPFHEFPIVDFYQDAWCLCVPVPYLWPLPSDLKPPHLLCWKVCSPQIQITAVNATCNLLQRTSICSLNFLQTSPNIPTSWYFLYKSISSWWRQLISCPKKVIWKWIVPLIPWEKAVTKNHQQCRTQAYKKRSHWPKGAPLYPSAKMIRKLRVTGNRIASGIISDHAESCLGSRKMAEDQAFFTVQDLVHQ